MMGKRCCRSCGSGNSCCGCCCSKRGATVCFSLVGLVLAVAVIVPPVYVYAATEERNFKLLFPVLELSKDALQHVRFLLLVSITLLVHMRSSSVIKTQKFKTTIFDEH